MESSGIFIEEQKLMTEAKYRVYMSNIDKALKNFEYSSEWADLISALGKLNKAISSNAQYQIIPRRIKISKRLAQCMHPALPSGVHLKALETYDVIFSKTGPDRLATELFIYSSGLFPLLGYAAMNVRPTLLGIYETYFVPLGDKLRPALSGFLSGVIPGYEAGLDHFDRTNSLLNQVCTAVNPTYFYTCLWECVATNASIRLPAVSYLLDHFNKRLAMHEQLSIMGKSHDVLLSGLCACLNDPVILVQRNTLEFLLLGFPMHTNLLSEADFIRLVTNGLNTILRRDMSLNRRLYSWLLGSEVSSAAAAAAAAVAANQSQNQNDESTTTTTQTYFEKYSKIVLIKALKSTLKISLQHQPIDLKPYRILISLLDKVEIGPAVLDHVLCDVIRTMALSSGNIEVSKSANLLFATFDPAYIWNFMTQCYEKSCKIAAIAVTSENTNAKSKLERNLKIIRAASAEKISTKSGIMYPDIDSGEPALIEICVLTEFLLETISLEMYNETTRVYLPRVFLSIIQQLTTYAELLSHAEVMASLKLCMKIVSRVQPMITSPVKLPASNAPTNRPISEYTDEITKMASIDCGTTNALEKSKSDSKINQSSLDNEPMRRSNSNNQIKKSPKKTKKSKSYSKLLELDKNISTSADDLMPTNCAHSTPDLDSSSISSTSGKLKAKAKRFSPSMKIKNIKGKITSNTKYLHDNENTPNTSHTNNNNNRKSLSPAESLLCSGNNAAATIASNTTAAADLSLKLERQETTIQEYSILEKCIKQYEMFFQVYLASQVLNISNGSRKIADTTITSATICSVTVNLVNDFDDSNNTIKLSTHNSIIEDDCPERVCEINRLFDTLKLSEISRTTKLHNLLHNTIMKRGGSTSDCNNSDSNNDYKDCFSSSEILTDDNDNNNAGRLTIKSAATTIDPMIDKAAGRLMNLQLSDSLKNCVKLASALLIEMSTFPNYNQNMMVSSVPIDVPVWLKVLVLIACYCKLDKELQIGAIQTLFDLIGLLKSQIEHSTNPGVTYVVMLPLLKSGHVSYLETKSRTIQVIVSTLWDYMNDSNVDSSQISSLLYQLHNCLPSGIVEDVIGHRISNAHLEWSDTDYCEQTTLNLPNDSSSNNKPIIDRTVNYKRDRLSAIRILCTPPTHLSFNCNEYLTESDAARFKKFELLWEHGRESGQNTKGFEKTLFKIFDYLTLPNYVPIRTFVTKWFQESLLRGDINRLIRPLLKILLASNTKRISVLHAHLLRRTVIDPNDSDSLFDHRLDDCDGSGIGGNDGASMIDRDVYAISSEDGNIKYHMDHHTSKHKRSPIRSLQKKFFGVTITNKNKTSNYISDKNIVSSPPSISDGTNIQLIVNPLDNNSSSDLDTPGGGGRGDHSNNDSIVIKQNLNDEQQQHQQASLPNNKIEISTDTNSVGQISGSVKEEDEYYSSCEEETDDESFSEIESDRHDESLDRELVAGVITSSSCPQQSSGIQRFSGDCERVSELLTEHDRTKNRKTYNVTSKVGNNSAKVIEKVEMSLTDVSEGIGIQTDESTTAEEYFNDNNSLGNNQSNTGEIIDEKQPQQQKFDDQTTIPSTKFVRSASDKQTRREKQKALIMEKRLSGTSKTSSDSNPTPQQNRQSIEPLMTKSTIEYEQSDGPETKPRSNSIDERCIKLMKNDELSMTTGTTRTPEWDKNQETFFDNSKKNVEILRQNVAAEAAAAAAKSSSSDGMKKSFNFNRKLSYDRRHKYIDRLHPLHTHMLLYYGLYDTKQVMYAFQTLRNIIICDCRTFLCLSITTSVSNSMLKHLLVRHRKSIFGKGFTGTILNTEFSHAYRGCMYLEVLITLCLYYARTYFQKEAYDLNRLPTAEDINSNCKIQLASIELLTIICNELITIVRDMGKGLACYIGDLMAKCKLQKIILNCITSAVHQSYYYGSSKFDLTFTEQILSFNDLNDDRLHTESVQIQLLRLLLNVIKLEYEVTNQKGDADNQRAHASSSSTTIDGTVGSTAIPSTANNGNNIGTPASSSSISNNSPTRLGPNTITNTKYLPNCLISQQPMFLYAVLKALQSDHLRHLHRNWTNLVTSALNCFTFGSLTNIVISTIHQLCGNIDDIARNKCLGYVPPDYALKQLEAVTVLCHYCLLDSNQQVSLQHLFNQSGGGGGGGISSTSTAASTTGQQLFTNIVHAILSSSSSAQWNVDQTRTAHILAARNAVLSHLPVIVASVSRLWDTPLGQSRQVRQQLLELLSPISLHHGQHFLAAISVTWQERGDTTTAATSTSSIVTPQTPSFRQNFTADNDAQSFVGGGIRKDSFGAGGSGGDISSSFLPFACTDQLSLVKLVASIRVMPMDSFVQTLHQVVKSPPNIYHPPAGLSIEVSSLELFYFYMKSAAATQLTDCWTSLLALLRDGISLSPPAQFVILAILNEFVQRCPQMPFSDRKDLRDLHDLTSRLVEALSNVAGARLEQTTWLRRNLAVKEDLSFAYDNDSIGGGSSNVSGGSNFKEIAMTGTQKYSVQAQSVMAAVLANMLDVTYGSQEKDKVVTIITTLMYNIIPYLKNHTMRNIPSFYACSQLLSTISGYQYTRKAWRKDMFDLILDPQFFQMDISCLPFWRSIIDSLMTYDTTTFRELLGRVSLTQTGGLNLFTSREQEYEQRALLLKRLAFVIFCSELDQYHKHMPEIQEQLANSLRLPSVVPSVQSAVFLCFRVLLLRMSPDHVTSLWPTIIAEMVQVFLAIEQELKSDNEEFRTQSSQQLRLLSGIDAPWATNQNNGLLNQQHLLHWRAVQLETAKLLELSCVLPATNLPYFQMYRWAFVGSQYDNICSDIMNGGNTDDMQFSSSTSPLFIPHVRRIARLMDLRFTSHSPKPQANKGNYLTLTCQNITNLQDLYGFFSTIGIVWPQTSQSNDFINIEKDTATCLHEIETVLAADFLEKMPAATNLTAR